MTDKLAENRGALDSSSQEQSTRDKIKSLGHDTKEKTKSLLRRHRLSPEEQAAEHRENNPYDLIQDDPAFDPSQLIGQRPPSISGAPARLAGSVFSGLKAVAHPRTAAKKKAASKAAVQDRPYLSEEADMDFLEAHDNLAEAKTKSSRSHSSAGQEDVDKQQDRVDTMERLRQSRKIAWTTSRHIKRVVVCPKRDFPTPQKDDFYIVDQKTGQRHLDWQAWLQALNITALKSFAVNSMGHVDFSGQAPFDRDVTSRYLERILIASAPWQTWLFSLRSLYLWENPAKTKKWFAIWCFVWYMDHVVTFVLAFIAFKVLRNRFQPKQVEAMRESYKRALDQGTAAFKLNELITQHGSGDWLDPLANNIGPLLQTQLSDVADTLEMLNNFYDWRRPDKTWATLFWFACAILIGVLTPSGYSWKIVYMYTIITFFLARPVASLHPEYRHVANAFTWLIWDHPNDADWAMMYLREKAQETRADLISQRVEENSKTDISHGKAYVGSLDLPTITETETVPMRPREDSGYHEPTSDSDSDFDDAASFRTAESTTSILGGLDIISFRCFLHGLPGRLIIFSDGLRFQRVSPISSMRKVEWRHLWTDVVEMCKVTHSSLATSVTIEGLHITFTDGTTAKLESVHKRDRAFNCILGFSGMRFQVVQPTGELGTRKDPSGASGELFYETNDA